MTKRTHSNDLEATSVLVYIYNKYIYTLIYIYIYCNTQYIQYVYVLKIGSQMKTRLYDFTHLSHSFDHQASIGGQFLSRCRGWTFEDWSQKIGLLWLPSDFGGKKNFSPKMSQICSWRIDENSRDHWESWTGLEHDYNWNHQSDQFPKQIPARCVRNGSMVVFNWLQSIPSVTWDMTWWWCRDALSWHHDES